MNEFSITPFRGPHLLLLLLTAAAVLLYGLPAPLILAGYMYAVCALSRLTQRAEEVPFS